MEKIKTERGTLYGVGVGPGDPELMSLKAVRVLNACPVITAPQSAAGSMTALSIAAQKVDFSAKEILPLRFAMKTDPELCRAGRLAAAASIRVALDDGRDVAMLSLGDIGVYSSFSYVREELEPQGYRIVTVPAVTSFCAAASALGQSLAEDDEPLTIIPAGAGPEELRGFLGLPGNKVIMKSGRQLPAVLRLLSELNLTGQTSMAENCGLPGERILMSLAGFSPDDEEVQKAGYFVTLLVHGAPGSGKPEGGAQ